MRHRRGRRLPLHLLLRRLHLSFGLGVGQGQAQARELFEEFLTLGRYQSIVHPIVDQALGMGEQVACMIKLPGRAGASGEHLRQCLGCRLQHRQQIARRIGQRPLRAP